MKWCEKPLRAVLPGVLLCALIVREKGFSVQALLFCVCTVFLIALSAADLRRHEIPVGCNLGIGTAGLLQLWIDSENRLLYGAGFFAVSGFLLTIYLISGRRAIGGGDIKLMAAAGLLLGWKNILAAFMIGFGAAGAAYLALMKWKTRERTLALGPFLSIGIFTAMLYGDRLLGWYWESP